jgi:actin related protein 2/3 complex subunit 2
MYPFCLYSEKAENVDVSGADFDATQIKIVSDEKDKNILYISLNVVGGDKIAQYGMNNILKNQYGSLLVDPVSGYTATLKLDFTNPDEATKKKYMETVPLFKKYIMMAPFVSAFDKFKKGEKFEPIRIPYRSEENIYIVSYEKALVVIYSILFVEPDDIVLAKTFLQELKDAKKDRALGNAPAVNFTQGAKPLELRETIKSSEPDDPKQLKDWGFISMSLFERHVEEKNRDAVIERLVTFRSYLHYHLKCSKAYMHIRMRDRVVKLLQNLEAAKDLSGKKVEKRTASGRTFTRSNK